MRRSSSATQLSLIEMDLQPVPAAAARPRRDGARRRAQAVTNAYHCQALLAELERVEQAQRDRAQIDRALAEGLQPDRAQQLADLYAAFERAHEAAPTAQGPLASGDRGWPRS
jgi:hypothetical protein